MRLLEYEAKRILRKYGVAIPAGQLVSAADAPQVRNEVVLKVFPFMIHYTVDEDNKTVIVSAVLHTSRDPQEWKKR